MSSLVYLRLDIHTLFISIDEAGGVRLEARWLGLLDQVERKQTQPALLELGNIFATVCYRKVILCICVSV